MKKTLLFLLLAIMANTTLHAYDACINGIYYNFSGNYASVTYRSNSSTSNNAYSGTVYIPSSVTYNRKSYTVTSIGNSAFASCPDLTFVAIPNSVESIGVSAFLNCTGLTSITIPESVKRGIGASAFYGCTGLTSITIPNSVTNIDNATFSGCTGLTFISIPESVKSIGASAFYGCTGLTSIFIPESVNSIGDNAFYYCSSLTSISIPSQVTSINGNTFRGCSALTSVTIPNSVRSIGNWAFSGCSALTSIVIPEGVTSIGGQAFSGCKSLASMTIPSSVTSIDSRAFKDCYFMKEFFNNKTSLASDDNWGAVLCDEITNEGLMINDGVAVGCRDWAFSVITIPSTVNSIGDSAFRGCTGLTSVTIPEGVTSIGYYAFYGCSALTSVTIPNSVTSIGDYAFSGTPFINDLPDGMTYFGKIAYGYKGEMPTGTKITIRPGTKMINDGAFRGCTGLTSVTIPESVTNIGYNAFSGCTGLTSVTIPNSVTSIGDYTFSGCTGLTSVTIPESVTSIGDNAFSGCTGLTSVTIPESVTSIGGGAFSGCTGLTSITIPESVTSIGYNAFDGCLLLYDRFINNSGLTDNYPWGATLFDEETIDGLIIKDRTVVKCKEWTTAVTIPEGMTSIGNHAFSNCTGLTSITIPSSVTSIGNSAFSGCTGLTSVTIPESVASIGETTFSNCTGLVSVTIPNSVTSIGKSAFLYCCSLTSVNIPNSVTSIGNYAFDGCSGLTSVTIPNSVTSIGGGAFSTCPSLTSIIVEEGNRNYDSRNNCNAIIETASNTLIVGCQNTVIPNSVTSVGEQAFRNCSGLTSIDIPNSVTCIGDGAFEDCSGLTSVTIPESVTSIGKYAFEGCSSLTSVTIPSSVTSIGDYAFRDCSGLNSVTILESVTDIGYADIGYGAFFTGSNLLIICNREHSPSTGQGNLAIASPGTNVIVPESLVERYKTWAGGKLSINTGFGVAKTTQTTATLVTSSLLSSPKAYLNGHYYYPDGDTLKITGLSPGQTYNMSTSFEYNGTEYHGYMEITTSPVALYINKVGATNTSITVRGSYNAGDATIRESGFEGMAMTDEFTLTGLAPNTQHTFTYYVVCSDGRKISKTATFSTIPVSIAVNAYAEVSSCLLKGRCWGLVDATFSDCEFKDSSNEIELKLTGLDPETQYAKPIFFTLLDGNTISTDVSFTTKPLTMTTQQPNVISLGNVIVAAETNLDDAEENVGFEWRGTDWGDLYASQFGVAYLYEGMMEGYIKDLYYLEHTLYKYRPYYESNSGNRYYGEWVGIVPTSTSYFEPTVRTYATISVTGTRAEVKGYAMRGTDKVTSQGFMCWKSSSSYSLRKKVPSIPSDAVTVEAKGNVMTAVFEDLDYETEYCYVAFVKTEENETFFGEVLTFSTSVDPDGIKDLRDSKDLKEEWYDLSGRKLDKPQRGINILRYSDGTTRKVLIK